MTDGYSNKETQNAAACCKIDSKDGRCRFERPCKRGGNERIWFRYCFEKDILECSEDAADIFGIPRRLEKPMENEAIKKSVSQKAFGRLNELVNKYASFGAFCDENIILAVKGKNKRFRMTVQRLSEDAEGNENSLIAVFTDIDDAYRRLEQIGNDLGKGENAEDGYMSRESGNDGLSVTREQAAALICYFRQMFTFVRLVDPEICMQLAVDSMGGEVERPHRCCDGNGGGALCSGCVTDLAARTGRASAKVEYVSGQIYTIAASCIRIDGRLYILELVTHIDHDDIIARGDRDEVLKSIAAHNRQLYIDPVTGVHNRRYFDDKLRNLRGEFAFAMLDLDNFKQINDTFGHDAGDAALAAAARAIKSCIRGCDDLIRYGGDEFFLLLRDMPKAAIERKLSMILHSVEGISFDEYPGLKMTISIGGAYEKGKLSQILRKADMAMYEAKENRNSYAIYDD